MNISHGLPFPEAPSFLLLSHESFWNSHRRFGPCPQSALQPSTTMIQVCVCSQWEFLTSTSTSLQHRGRTRFLSQRDAGAYSQACWGRQCQLRGGRGLGTVACASVSPVTLELTDWWEKEYRTLVSVMHSVFLQLSPLIPMGLPFSTVMATP